MVPISRVVLPWTMRHPTILFREFRAVPSAVLISRFSYLTTSYTTTFLLTDVEIWSKIRPVLKRVSCRIVLGPGPRPPDLDPALFSPRSRGSALPRPEGVSH